MEIRLYDSARDAELLRSFNQKIFGAPTSQDSHTETSQLTNPYGNTPGPTAIALADGAIVGHLTSTPSGLWFRGEEKVVHWLSGFHVLESTRGSGVGKKLVACLTQALPALSAVVVVEPSLKAFLANQWLYPGKIHEYLHIAKPRALSVLLTRERVDRFLPKAMKPLAGLLLTLAKLPAQAALAVLKLAKGIPSQSARGKSLPFIETDSFGSDVDALWEKAKHRHELTHVRRSEYMNWMFPTQRGWKKAVRTSNGTASAWLLYTIVPYTSGPLRGLKALNIIDALWDLDRPQEADDLIHYILSLGYSAEVDLILLSGNNKMLNEAASKGAFIKIPSTVYVGFREHDGTQQYAESFANAYITRGYADAAGNLGPQ